ncbi:MAG: ChbG/HpnK family deacetylase [Chryseolinea sp.]
MPLVRILLLLFLSYDLSAQSSLPRSTPEAEGVSSKHLMAFLDAAGKSDAEFHSIMVLRHGKVVAEGWWNPYSPDTKHTLYSVSKSFTATAIGFAATEKKLTIEDKVISFFPDDLPAEISPNLSELRIKHLLTMSVGQDKEPGGIRAQENWVRKFLETPIANAPGTKFHYNSMATFMLSAIVQKVTGQTVLEYLEPRLFSPLNIVGMDWEINPKGINVGGWGLRLKTEDLAKFGQLFLNKGKFNGKTVLPAAWIEEATTMKIMQDPDAPAVKKDSSDWLQGYCYQMWRGRNNSYRADGAFGQYILVLPEKDAVIAITSETSNMQAELDLVWKYILPAFNTDRLPADRKSSRALKGRLDKLALHVEAGRANQAMEATVSGKNYAMISNDRKLQGISLNFQNGTCVMALDTDSTDYRLSFGSGAGITGVTEKFGPYLVAGAKSNRIGLPPFRISGTYAWKDEKTIELFVRYIESPHHETIRITFDGDYAMVEWLNSFNNSIRASKAVLRKAIPNPPRLIVRGDDMGFSHSANLALIKSYKEGIETSIEVIAPSPWFPETVRLLAANPRVDVGLHFAITSEWDNVKWRPLTACPSLQNEDGYFYPMLFKNRNYPGQAIMDHEWKLDDIEKELRSQIQLAKKYIPRLSHVSGHMGSTGFDPKVKAMVARVAQEYKLATVDSDQSLHGFSYAHFDPRGKSTEQRIDAFIEMINKFEDGKTYVFVEHPGLDNDELRAISHIGYTDVAEGRQDVTTIFTSEKVREAIERRGVRLVSYKQALEK